MSSLKSEHSVNHGPLFLQRIQQLVSVLSDTLMGYFNSSDLVVNHKADQSPVSEADYSAQALIEEHLSDWLPGVPLLSEEGPKEAFDDRKAWSRYWLVDPLDGTREFIAKRPEFSVNIALIEEGLPVWGLLLMPGLKHFFFGGPGLGVMFGEIGQNFEHYQPLQGQSYRLNLLPADTLGVAASRHYGREFVERFSAELEEPSELVVSGSAVKFAHMVRGDVAVYPRFTPVCEWDLAAGHALLLGVGGEVFDSDGRPWRYNQKARLDEVTFLAVSRKQDFERFYPVWQHHLR